MPWLACSMHMTKILSFRFVCNNGSYCSHYFYLQCCMGSNLLILCYFIEEQVSVNDEGRDMWKVYLDMKEYAAALANCRDPLQKDQVYLAQVMWNKRQP